MATLHSGYEFDALQSHNARRPSAYVEPAQNTVEELRKTAATTNPSFSPIQEDIQDQSTYTTSNSTPRQASIYESTIELDAINPQHDTNNATELEFSLPPVDGGKDAWLFLFSAFILEVLVWGTHFPPSPQTIPTHMTYTSQASPSHTAFSKNTTPRTRPSRGPATSPSSARAPWG
jgi:hypothetical protein